VARAYGVAPAEVERGLLDHLPAELYLAGTVWHLDRVAGPAGGGPTPAVTAAAVDATAPEWRDVRVSAWMVADHGVAPLRRALDALVEARRRPRPPEVVD